jgi:hypothetical protein
MNKVILRAVFLTWIAFLLTRAATCANIPAFAFNIGPAADSYVQGGSAAATNFGATNTKLYVKNSSIDGVAPAGDANMSKGYLQFALSGYPFQTIASATLTLYPVQSIYVRGSVPSPAQIFNFDVWGICRAGSSALWQEEDEEPGNPIKGITWNNAIANDKSSAGVVTSTSGISSSPVATLQVVGTGLDANGNGIPAQTSDTSQMGTFLSGCIAKGAHYVTFIVVRGTDSTASGTGYINAFASCKNPLVSLRPVLSIAPKLSELTDRTKGEWLTPDADTYIAESSPGANYGSRSFLEAKYDSSYTRLSLIRFSFPANTVLSGTAALVLTPVASGQGTTPPATQWTFNVYGVESATQSAGWNQSTLTWNNSFLQSASDLTAFYDQKPLGSFSFEGTGVGSQIVIASPALTDYVNRSITRGEEPTFVIARANMHSTDSYVHAFSASRSGEPPLLRISPLTLTNNPALSDDFTSLDIGTSGSPKWLSGNGACTDFLSLQVEQNAVVSGASGGISLLTDQGSTGEEPCVKDWSTASIWTSASQQYGYLSTSMKIAGASGQDNAFWAHTAPQPGATACEVDVNEAFYPHELTMTEHKLKCSQTTGKSCSEVSDVWALTGYVDSSLNFANASDLSADFHTYSAEWNPDEIVWYFDGQVVRRMVNTFCSSSDHVSVSTAVLTDNPDLAEKSTQYRYVKTYQYK